MIRNSHRHLGVYSLALHPMLEAFISGGRDSYARVWGKRTLKGVHILDGDTNTVASAVAQDSKSQIITVQWIRRSSYGILHLANV